MSDTYEGVVVLGMPRSGTTLLRRLINAHPDFACPPETNLLSAGGRFLEEAHFTGGLSVGVVPGLGFSGIDREAVLTRTREFLFGFLRDVRDRAGKPYWVEKTAVDVFHIDAIEALCGAHCRYVCIVRHPLDVICSLEDLCRKMQSHLPEIYHYIQRYRSPIEAYAHAWVEANRRLQAFVTDHPEWCVSLRYEDLVTAPEAELKRVFDFLQRPADCDDLVARALRDRGSAGLGDWKTYASNEINRDSVGRHRELGRWTLSSLAPLLNPVMMELGYEALVAGAAGHSEDSERSHELARLVAGMRLSGDGSE